MKQIYLHILAAAFAALTLTACDKDDIEPDSGDVAPVFTAIIRGGQTRAIGCDWEPGDEIGISAYYTSSANNVYNVCHVVTQNVNGDTVTVKNAEERIYYRTSSRTGTGTFNAYYPYTPDVKTSIGNNTSVEINTSVQANQKSFDFLFASAKGTKDQPAVELEFNHIMSKVTFVFKNGHEMDVSTLDYYTLSGFVMEGTFTINSTSGICSVKSGATASPVRVELTGVEEGVAVNPCILIPQTAKSDPVLEIFDRDGNSYTCNLTFSSTTYRKIDAGKNYKFTITVHKTGLAVGDCTIEDWIPKEDTGWGAGTAASADDPGE